METTTKTLPKIIEHNVIKEATTKKPTQTIPEENQTIEEEYFQATSTPISKFDDSEEQDQNISTSTVTTKEFSIKMSRCDSKYDKPQYNNRRNTTNCHTTRETRYSRTIRAKYKETYGD